MLHRLLFRSAGVLLAFGYRRYRFRSRIVREMRRRNGAGRDYSSGFREVASNLVNLDFTGEVSGIM